MASADRKQKIVSALCKHLSVDEKIFSSNLDSDLKSLCTSILKSSEGLVNNDQLMKWIAFAENFLIDGSASTKCLGELNEDLLTKSVLLGNGLKPSVADVIVFSAVHASVIGLPASNRDKFPHLMRWMDYIQNKENVGQLFEKILLQKVQFEPLVIKSVKKVEPDSNAKKNVQEKKVASAPEADVKGQKSSESKKGAGDKQATADAKKVPEKGVDEKDKDLSVSLLKIQIGLIRKAYKHPSADSLLVEEIDVGEVKHRQVVSGLAKYCTLEQLTNRLVVLVTNVKPGKLRDVLSEGLVLCASDKDKNLVEPLIAPDGAKIGECVTFSGHEGKPEDVLNPKKKQLDKISEHLFTNDKGVATFKGIPFMTSAGPCTSSIPNGNIK